MRKKKKSCPYTHFPKYVILFFLFISSILPLNYSQMTWNKTRYELKHDSRKPSYLISLCLISQSCGSEMGQNLSEAVSQMADTMFNAPSIPSVFHTHTETHSIVDGGLCDWNQTKHKQWLDYQDNRVHAMVSEKLWQLTSILSMCSATLYHVISSTGLILYALPI